MCKIPPPPFLLLLIRLVNIQFVSDHLYFLILIIVHSSLITSLQIQNLSPDYQSVSVIYLILLDLLVGEVEL